MGRWQAAASAEDARRDISRIQAREQGMATVAFAYPAPANPGTRTAGATWTSTEAAMLQYAYDAARALDLVTVAARTKP